MDALAALVTAFALQSPAGDRNDLASNAGGGWRGKEDHGLGDIFALAYNCAKAGIEALTRTLALEGRDLSIRVNAIAPGLADTASNIAAMKPKDLKRWTVRECLHCGGANRWR